MSRHTFNLFVSSSEKEPTAATPNATVIPGTAGVGIHPKKVEIGGITRFVFYNAAVTGGSTLITSAPK